MRSDPFCSTLTRSEHGTITFLSQQFFAKGPPSRSVREIVFERYAVVSQADIAEALGRLELHDGHSLGPGETTEADPDEAAQQKSAASAENQFAASCRSGGDACANSSEETRERKTSWRAESALAQGPGLCPNIHNYLHFLISIEGNSGPLGIGWKDNEGNEIKLTSRIKMGSASRSMNCFC
jgi:hypothetical protein